ncbi:MAG TPA: putative quinol monooxygenase [Burkholderiaceae bacterium]|jgi:quinol monooxygenase YgiN|nr:putative quinol monooxygenase [Burkholderiaceae bacterium]
MPNLDRRTAVLGGAVSVLFSSSSRAAPAKKDTGYYVIAEINAKPGSESALRDLLVPFAKSSRKEPGCLVYTLMEVISEPGRFLTFERWTNKAALEAHMVTPAIKAIVPKLEPVLAKPFTQIFLNGQVGAPAHGT